MIRAGWRRLTMWLRVSDGAKLGKKPEPRLAVTFDPQGFSVAPTTEGNQSSTLRVRWSDVQKIAVFKRDLYIVDMVCLLVELPGPSTVELHEEMEGWQPFVEALPRFLPGATPWHEWFMGVAFPAFEAKPTLVFSR